MTRVFLKIAWRLFRADPRGFLRLLDDGLPLAGFFLILWLLPKDRD